MWIRSQNDGDGIKPYVQDYGQGEFQDCLDIVLEELKKLGEVLRPLSDDS
jgi:hypothetical protein